MKLLTPLTTLLAGLLVVTGSAYLFTRTPQTKDAHSLRGATAAQLSQPMPEQRSTPLAPTAPAAGHLRPTVSDTLARLDEVEASPLTGIVRGSTMRPWTQGPFLQLLERESGRFDPRLLAAMQRCDPLPRLAPGTRVLTAQASETHALLLTFPGDPHPVRYGSVTVNAPNQRVFLVLQSYEPTASRVSVKAGSLARVFASGYHAQAVLGVAPEKVAYASHVLGGCAAYLQSARLTASQLQALGVGLADVELVEAQASGAPAATSTPVLMNFVDTAAPAAGRLGMATLHAMGALEPREPVDSHNVVARKGFVWPAGLHGAHAVALTVPEGVEAPSGDPGHSTLER